MSSELTSAPASATGSCRVSDCEERVHLLDLWSSCAYSSARTIRVTHPPCVVFFAWRATTKMRSRFALGYLLAQDATFCAQLMRQFRIAPPKTLNAGYSVHLQEVTNPGYGRRDIVIENR